MTVLEWQWAAYARYLARSKKPIICGPFRSEVGFETLYWIPFLTAFRERYKIPKERFIYIGRGGSAQWFDSAGRADLFEFLPPDTVRSFTVQDAQQTGSIKQHATRAWERDVCNLAAKSMGIERFHLLSPAWMYRLLAPFWTERQSLAWLDRYLLQPVRLSAPPLDLDLRKALPAKYIAMRWYARPTWPLREDLLLWARTFTEVVASRMPVVLITSGLHMDDHADMTLGSIPNVVALHEVADLSPLDNLAVQSSVIANASGYIGTYGGMAQGAMRWGVPTLSFYEQFGQTAPAHLQLTHSLSLKSGVPFIATFPKAVDALMPLVPLRKEVTA